MICGSLKNAQILNAYGLLSLYSLITEALKYDNRTNTGRVELVPGLVFANFDEGTTEDESARKYEYHKDYLDVHIIIKGAEKIGFRTELLKDSDESIPFDNDRDLGFLANNENGDHVTLKEGDFAIFAPLELHQPLCAVSSPAPIRKIVLKVHANYLRKNDQ